MSDEILREMCDKNYHQLLQLIAEKMQKEKEQLRSWRQSLLTDFIKTDVLLVMFEPLTSCEDGKCLTTRAFGDSFIVVANYVSSCNVFTNKYIGMLQMNSSGILQLISDADTNTTIWSSSFEYLTNVTTVAQLLDNGNFVIRDENRSNEENFIWQSFDYPGNTYLPGMKLGKDFIRGIDRQWVSWKSLDDPSRGEYAAYMDTNGFPQVFLRRGPVLHTRYGPWNGIRFSGMPSLTTNPTAVNQFVVNDKEIYYGFEVNASVLSRLYLNPEGIDDVLIRNVFKEWYCRRLSSGCMRRTTLGSWEYVMVMRMAVQVRTIIASFSAYANLDIRNGGSGCLLWFDELLDVREYNETQNLYIRMAVSELPSFETRDSGSSKQKPIIIVAVSILVGLFLVGLTFAFYARSKKRTSYMKRQGSVCEGQKEEADIPSFSLSKISKSTNNFSITNKLGEGGFGPVYKYQKANQEGWEIIPTRINFNLLICNEMIFEKRQVCWNDGQEIAVKR
ncbi:G-type lectin S-receptor-like serine/threonine-protein kinase [Tanacetum coccineum]